MDKLFQRNGLPPLLTEVELYEKYRATTAVRDSSTQLAASYHIGLSAVCLLHHSEGGNFSASTSLKFESGSEELKFSRVSQFRVLGLQVRTLRCVLGRSCWRITYVDAIQLLRGPCFS